MVIRMKKTSNLITVIVFVGIMAILSVLFVLKKDDSFSEQENRDLQTLPEFTIEALIDGSYSKKINSYFSDQFPFRDTFVGIKGISERALLKGENNEVLLGKDGFLAVRSFSVYDGKNQIGPTDYYFKKVLNAHFSSVKKLRSRLEEGGTEFAIMIPPRTIDVAASKFNYPAENSDKLQAYIKEGLKDANYIDILPILKTKLEDGEYVYYKTDHHFTTLGAYYSYCEVMKQFDLERDIIPLGDFTAEKVSDNYYGTTWSKSGFKFVAPDSIYFYHYNNGDENEYTTVKDGSAFTGFYDRSLLGTKDKYSSFIGGNSFRTSITKTSGADAGERPKLLLVKDSFGLSLAPFLALHFDLEIVNVANMHSVSGLASEYGCDYVLIVYNTENLISNRFLAYNS